MAQRFLIVDGYPRQSREQFEEVGMRLAGVLYRDMLHRYVPGCEYDLWYVTDADSETPSRNDVDRYTGILWPGCSQTVYHDTPEVREMVRVATDAYEVGTPAFGSCWGIQIAAHAAGGRVEPHPRGREMGLTRQLTLTEAGRKHPMMEGKPQVYSHFASHDDEVTELPAGATLLAGNDWSPVQAATFDHRNGSFWAVQYHPEYDLHELARLILCRQEKLIRQGLFHDPGDLARYVDRLEELHRDPNRQDLRWQLAIGDDLIDPTIREREFANWLQHLGNEILG